MGTCPCTVRSQGSDSARNAPTNGVVPVQASALLPHFGSKPKPEPEPAFDPAEGCRVLVTGATGLLGRQVMRVFTSKGYKMRGLGFSRAGNGIEKCDIFNREALAEQIKDFQPQILVNCAAERRPDVLEADKDYALRINAEFAQTLGELCQEHRSWLIHLSTNYVFDGTGVPYAEDAEPNPVNVYGESKLAGERKLTEVYPEAAIVRVPLLYGPIEKLGESSVDQLLKDIRGGTRSFDDWQERYPTNSEDLALVLERLVATYTRMSSESSSNAKLGGIFHWQSNECHTKYSMALAIAEMAGIDTSDFTPVKQPPEGSAKRPQYERMTCARLEALLHINGQSQAFRSDLKDNMWRILAPFLNE